MTRPGSIDSRELEPGAGKLSCLLGEALAEGGTGAELNVGGGGYSLLGSSKTERTASSLLSCVEVRVPKR